MGDRSRIQGAVWVPAVAAVALAAGPAAAVDEDIFFSALPVVASVSRLQQPLADAPGSVTVIDRDMIRASGVRDLNDLFRLVPGFNTYPFNTDLPPRVAYHGLTDEDFAPRVQVLIDGRSQYSPLFRGGVNWATIPVALEDIERIEVVRGSNSAAYGSNAFLGVINIITVDPSQVRGVSLSANHGNQGVRDHTVRGGGALGEAGSFRFTYQRRDDKGLTDRYDWKDNFDAWLFDFRSQFALSERDELQIGLGHVEGISGTGRLRASSGSLVLPRQEDPCSPFYDILQTSTYVQAAWRRALEGNADLQVRFAHTEDTGSGNHVERCTDTRLRPPAVPVSTNQLLYRVDLYGDKGVRDELEVQHTFSPWANSRLVWGGGGRWEWARSETFFHDNPTRRRQVLRLFANLEWKAQHWLTLNAGASAEDDTMTGPTISPRLAANFHLDAQNTLRFGVSRAYRIPSLIELRGDRWKSPFATSGGVPIAQDQLYVRRFFADRNLNPERIDSIELGYLGDWKGLRMSLDTRLFHEHIPNRIVELSSTFGPDFCRVASGPPFNCTTTTANSALNAMDVVIEGVEYQWRWQPLEHTRLLFNQAFIHIYAGYLPELTTSSGLQTLTNTRFHAQQSAPRRSATAMLMQKLPWGLEFSATHHWLGAMKWSRNSRVEPYRRLDLRVGYPFRYQGWGGEIAYTLQSANGEHGEFKYDPMSTDLSAAAASRVVSERQWLTLRLDF